MGTAKITKLNRVIPGTFSKILILRSDRLGDVLLTLPLVENIKKQIRKRVYQDAREILRAQQMNKTITSRIMDLFSENRDLSKQERIVFPDHSHYF